MEGVSLQDGIVQSQRKLLHRNQIEETSVQVVGKVSSSDFQNNVTITVALGCLSEAEGKSLLSKTAHKADPGLQ